MDRIDHRIFHRIRNAFQSPVFQLPPNPSLRRRLYGAFFALAAAAFAPVSAEMIGDQRLARWLQQNPPRRIHWETLARSRSLGPVSGSPLHKRLLRQPPQDWTPGTVWWNAETQTVWIIPPAPALETETVEDPWLFSRTGTPPKNGTQKLDWRFLGLGWKGFENLAELELPPISVTPKPERPQKRPPEDPRQWHF